VLFSETKLKYKLRTMKTELVDFDSKDWTMGGKLHFTAESSADVVALCARFKPFNLELPEELVKYADAIRLGSLVVEDGSEKRPYFRIETALDVEWLEPYAKRLRSWVGWGELEQVELEFPCLVRPLCHTHSVTRAFLDGGHLCFEGYQQASEWNGKAAHVRAEKMFLDYVQEDIGARKQEPEYIGINGGGGGLLKRNPNYLRRNPPHPHLSHAGLFNALFSWWRANRASDAQKRLLVLGESLKGGGGAADFEGRQGYQEINFHSYGSFHYLAEDGKGHPWGSGQTFHVMTWEEFQKLA
jgi:hypothetical protein